MEKTPAVLVTFDVDGTLMSMDGARHHLHKEAFSHAFKQVFDIDAHIDEIVHNGSTDPLIMIEVLELHGVSREKVIEALPELKRVMEDFVNQSTRSAAEGGRVLPGVPELLRALGSRSDVAFGLVTGNLEPIAWRKMQDLELLPLFPHPRFGGFSGEYCGGDPKRRTEDRAALLKVAQRHAEELFPDRKFVRWYHVGDAPADIRAAELAGSLAVGVCTGQFPRADLQASSHSPDTVILDSLRDLQQCLAVFGLEQLPAL
eukprot:RCo034801